jgi:hypothetical protein
LGSFEFSFCAAAQRPVLESDMKNLAQSLLFAMAFCAAASAVSAQNFTSSVPTPPVPRIPADREPAIGSNLYYPQSAFYCGQILGCPGPTVSLNEPPLPSAPIVPTPTPTAPTPTAPTPTTLSEITPTGIAFDAPGSIPSGGAPGGVMTTVSGPDADSSPAIYMKYRDALRLGNQMLQQQRVPWTEPAAGDVAAASRAAQAQKNAEAPAPVSNGAGDSATGNSSSAAKPAVAKHLVVMQDNSGKMIVCSSDSKPACP